MTVVITERAAEKFKQLSRDGNLPRVEISAGGCNGFDKKFSIDVVKEDDIVIKLENGASLIMDPMTDMLLSNSVIDFKQGLNGSQFTIEVPEASSTCGCGSSFSL